MIFRQNRKTAAVPPELKALFTSPHAAELHLRTLIGYKNSVDIINDLYSEWGPRLCSGDWHVTERRDGQVEITGCNCVPVQKRRGA